MRKIFCSLLIVGGALFVLNKTHLGSYGRTAWSQVKQEVKAQVPTRFEIDRARQEIGRLDGDIGNMIHPIAEYTSAVNRLKKDVASQRASLEQNRATLLTMTHDLDGNPTSLVYDGETYSADRVRQKLQRDFDAYKRLETNLKSSEKLLEAKETALRATQDQLSKVLAKRREFELRLAQLEADEELLQIAQIGSKLPIDNARTAEIEAALTEIEHRQDVARAAAELASGNLVNDGINVTPGDNGGSVDPASVRQYLEHPPAVASAKK